MTLREEILESIRQARVHGPYAVPVINKPVYVREVTVAEVDQIEEINKRHKNSEATKLAKLAIIACCMEDGSALFQKDDTESLKGLPLNALLGIVNEFNRVNGFGEDDVKELEKNS